MKLYLKAYSSYRGNLDELNVKKELKSTYKLDTRRQDTFIHLAIYGAQKLKDVIDINEQDELYITSGVGNIDVLQRTNKYVNEEKEFIKPFDFINMLGNTTSYYVASSLGLKDKNTFQISDNFTFINGLISLYASLNISGNDAILGAVDLVTTPDEVIKKVLGVKKETKVTSSVNYQKFSLNAKDALVSVEFDVNTYTLEEIKKLLENEISKIIVSIRCSELDYEKDEFFNETYASYVINEAVRKNLDTVFVDCYNERYKIIYVKSL